MNILDRDKLPLGQIGLTVTGTNWTTVRAPGLAYKTNDGAWRLKFNVYGTVTGTPTSLVLTIASITFKTGPEQGVVGVANPNIVTSNMTANGGAATMTFAFASGIASLRVSGDVELDSQPTFLA